MMEKTLFERLSEAGEPYAAGLFEYPGREALYRYCNAAKRFWQQADIMPYEGGALYPCGRCMGKGNPGIAVVPDYSYTFSLNRKLLSEKAGEECAAAVQAEQNLVSGFPTPHTVGGAGYTHSFIN